MVPFAVIIMNVCIKRRYELMNNEEYSCIKCGISVSQEQIDSGEAALINENAYCPEHYRDLARKAALDTQIMEEEEEE